MLLWKDASREVSAALAAGDTVTSSGPNGFSVNATDAGETTEPDGSVFERQLVASRAENNPPGLKITEDVKDLRLLVTGDTAVMSYRSDVRLEGGGMSGPMPTRQMTDVFVRKDGRWLLAASHSSVLATERKASK